MLCQCLCQRDSKFRVDRGTCKLSNQSSTSLREVATADHRGTRSHHSAAPAPVQTSRSHASHLPEATVETALQGNYRRSSARSAGQKFFQRSSLRQQTKQTTTADTY